MTPWFATRPCYTACRHVVNASYKRSLAQEASPPDFAKHIQVPVGSKGSITLRIHEGRPSRPLIIYLPPGPSEVLGGQHDTIPKKLARDLDATLVKICYRLGKSHRHPLPLHDVMAAYDWIIRHLEFRNNRRERNQLGILGEAVGGSLATALALTECDPSRPHIAAAALHESILDWVSIDDDLTSKRRTRRTKTASEPSTSDTTRLLSIRNEIFAKPADYFDPFASPLLFFRAAGAPVPSAKQPDQEEQDFADLAALERLDFHRQQQKLASLSNVSRNGDGIKTAKPLEARLAVKLRRSSLRFPPQGSGLVLPAFRLSHQRDSVLVDQIDEFAERVRRSMVRESFDQEHAEAEAEQRVTVLETGSWADNAGGDFDQVASWFHSILR